MKKVLLAVCLAVVCVFNMQAEFRFGIRAGVNVNNIDLNYKKLNMGDLFDGENRCGFTGGVMAEFVVPLIGVGADLSVMYSWMDSKIQMPDGSNKSLARNFIEIPLNIKYKLKLPVIERILIPYVYTGPSATVRVGKNLYRDITTKNCQWGWNLGLGLEFFKHLQVGAGYTFGINNIVKTFDLLPTTDVKIKNNYWTITAAYLF